MKRTGEHLTQSQRISPQSGHKVQVLHCLLRQDAETLQKMRSRSPEARSCDISARKAPNFSKFYNHHVESLGSGPYIVYICLNFEFTTVGSLCIEIPLLESQMSTCMPRDYLRMQNERLMALARSFQAQKRAPNIRHEDSSGLARKSALKYPPYSAAYIERVILRSCVDSLVSSRCHEGSQALQHRLDIPSANERRQYDRD